jgi:predicted nucleic acid-binding Zn ribbon protein
MISGLFGVLIKMPSFKFKCQSCGDESTYILSLPSYFDFSALTVPECAACGAHVSNGRKGLKRVGK